jgi:hypothetical protein
MMCLKNLVRSLFVVGLLIGCGQPGTDDGAAAPPPEESDITSAAKSNVSLEASLGLRADLRDALGQPAKGDFDFGAATVAGALTVSHQYSIERVDLGASSFKVGPSDAHQGGLTLAFPTGTDVLEASAQGAAKKLFDAMTAAKETTQHNPVLDSDLVVRASPKGLVHCAHSTAAKAPGQSQPEQYWCEVENVTSIAMTAAKK